MVTGTYLGTLSHTLTCLDVLARRKLAVKALVVNETPGSTVTMPTPWRPQMLCAVAQTVRA